MTTEINAASDAAAELPASELSQTPEVATPEAEPKPEADPVKALEERLEKERANFQRRLNRKHHDSAQAIAQARAEAQQLREQMQRLQPAPEGEQQQQLTPERVQELIKQEAQRLSQENAFRERVGRVLESGKAMPDFDSLVNAVSDEMPFVDDRGRPTAFMQAILDADKPHELLAYLGKNPDALESLHGLSEGQLHRRLDRLEQGLKQEPKPSKAPPPIKPPTGSGGSGDPSPSSPDYLDFKLKQLRGR